ncbi:ankyrin repeat-containing domain protein [Aspergillus tetrazonus]
MESNKPQNELDTIDSDLSSVVSKDVSEGSREPIHRLKLVNTVQLLPSEDSEPLDIDIIHVIGVDKERQLRHDTILGDTATSRRREFVFQCDISSFLLGNLVLDTVQTQAVQLLDDIVSLSDSNDSSNKTTQPARIFVAYDLGALVVNKAIAILSLREQRWPGVFYSAVQLIYSHCFLRRRDFHEFDVKVWKYLEAVKDGALWASLVVPVCVRDLTDAMVETTDLFLSSRITLLTRVVSIYAGENSKNTYSVFDNFTSTLGVSTEITVPEDLNGENEPAYDLENVVCYRKQNWMSSPEWLALQRMLLPLAHPQHQYASEMSEPPHEVLRSKPYKDWIIGPKSPVLYIQGKNEEHSRSLAEQVFLDWKSKLQGRKKYHTPVMSFSFSADDPVRANINSMICSAILQVDSAFRKLSMPKTSVLLDMHKFHRGWTYEDLHNLFLILVSSDLENGGLLVLHDVDECEIAGRRMFWDLLQSRADLSDSYIKVVVTSRRRLSLLTDSDKSSLWYVYEYEGTSEQLSVNPSPTYVARYIPRLCPGGYGESQVRKALQPLESMEGPLLEDILCLIQRHTHWPVDPSSHAWSTFLTLLGLVKPTSTPATILDGILRSIPDQIGLRWILLWLIYGHRPLSSIELACLLCHCNRTEGDQYFPRPAYDEIEKAHHLLKSWLPALVYFGPNQICVQKAVRDILLDENPEYVWNEIKPAVHQTALDFLSAYLADSEVQNRLSEIYDQYSSLGNPATELVPAVLPDGEDLVYYATTAFPYHLERSPQPWKHLEQIFSSSPGQRLTPWARLYWAMSNPFSRPSVEKLSSPLSVLLNTGSLDPAFRKALKSLMNATDSAAGSSGPSLNEFVPMNSLVRAMSIRDETAALKYIQRIVSREIESSEGDNDAVITPIQAAAGDDTWPSKMLWRATWLNMERLVDFLLQAGVCPDPKDVVSKRYPSPLYMASVFGHSRIAELLLRSGADAGVLREDGGMLLAAADNGHADTVRVLVTHNRGLLELEQPNTPLYGASLWGNWLAAKALLEFGARPDHVPAADGWAPIIAAADSGYVRTLRVLLENHADPNLCGPGGQDTALWWAAMRSQSVEAVRTLLENGADPNHELLKPPLVVELCSSSELSTEYKVALLDALINNTPPLDVDKADSHGSTGLVWASSSGHTPVVDWLLAHNANVSPINDEQRGAMHYAVANGHKEVVRRLLERKPPLDVLTDTGETLLQVSVHNGDELVRMLLDAGADPEQENGEGLTVINTAVLQQQSDVVKLLIDRGVNINHRDNAGWCPVHDASGHRPSTEIVRLFAEAGVNLEETTTAGQAPLHLAAGFPQPEIVALLLEYRGRLDIEQRNKDRETPLIKAAMSGNVECIRRLLRAGADINAQCSVGWTPLMSALNSRDPDDAVSFLLSQPGIDITIASKKHGAALHIACSNLHLEAVKKLLDHGADINQLLPGIRPTPLMAAFLPAEILDSETRGEFLDKIDQLVRTLIDRGADVKATYSTPISTLLCAAAQFAAPSTINYLVGKGLSLKDPGCLRRLPIHYAAVNGRENFEAVFQSDGDLLSTDVAGKNALHWAAQFGHVRTVEMILAHARTQEERQKRINHPDIDGWTALCWALRPHTVANAEIYSEPYDITQTVQVLIEGGADTSISFRMGKEGELFTVLELAKLHSASDEIITILKDAVAARIASSDGTGEGVITRSVRPYQEQGYNCDICLSTIWGPVYECETCLDFSACKKCHGRITLYHGHLRLENGEPHVFKLIIEADPEILDPQGQGSASSSNSRKNSEVDNRPGSKGDGDGDGDAVVDGTMEAIMNFSVDDDITEIGADDGASIRMGRSP